MANSGCAGKAFLPGFPQAGTEEVGRWGYICAPFEMLGKSCECLSGLLDQSCDLCHKFIKYCLHVLRAKYVLVSLGRAETRNINTSQPEQLNARDD